MVYVRIEDQTSQAKAVLELLKTMPFVEILEDYKPNYITQDAMSKAEEGCVEKYPSAKDLLMDLKL